MAKPVNLVALLPHFLVGIDDMAKGDPSRILTFEEISEKLDLSLDDVRILACHLKDHDWASVELLGQGSFLRITPKGSQQAQWYRVPGWKRWVKEHAIALVATTVISTILVILLTKLLNRFWP